MRSLRTSSADMHLIIRHQHTVAVAFEAADVGTVCRVPSHQESNLKIGPYAILGLEPEDKHGLSATKAGDAVPASMFGTQLYLLYTGLRPLATRMLKSLLMSA